MDQAGVLRGEEEEEGLNNIEWVLSSPKLGSK